MTDISIIIGTYGDEEWRDRGAWLESEMLERQHFIPGGTIETLHIHGKSLADARNSGARRARSPWLVFLDADDLLNHSYCAEFALARARRLKYDVLCPSVRGFTAEYTPEGYKEFKFIDDPNLPKPYPLIRRNFLPIGAPVTKVLFEFVGGFDEKWPVLEDWAFWLKCQKAGATFGQLVPACYLINDDHLRNKHPDIDKIANQIRAEYR